MVGHTVLNVLSFVPVFGNVADAFNAIWYAYEGNYAEAIACAVGAIPLIGNLATGFKIGSRVVKGCNIVANGGKAAIGFYNGVQNVMNVDRMIRTGTGRWYDYLGQGVQFGLNMFVSAVGVSGAWNGISNLVGELNYSKMQKLAQEVSWDDIDGGAELDKLLGTGRKFSRTSWTEFEFDLQFFADNADIPWSSKTVSDAAEQLANGAKTVNVSTRSQAEELFLGLYQGEGYVNVSGMDALDTKNLLGGKGNTYHWDDVFGLDGYLLGHGAQNPDAVVPHLQIHPRKGSIIRIFFNNTR